MKLTFDNPVEDARILYAWTKKNRVALFWCFVIIGLVLWLGQ